MGSGVSEFPTYHFFIQLTFFKYILYVLCNGTSKFAKQKCHLFLRKPNGFFFKTNINLDVIISVGYRVKSPQGTQFRIWATQRLREYLIKGFALNDDRFKSGSSMNYFTELQERIREIRISERFFYQKIKDIYTTSIDYDAKDEKTIEFFKVVQNKLLWAISQHTAAEWKGFTYPCREN